MIPREVYEEAPDWGSDQSELRLNPRLPEELARAARRGLREVLGEADLEGARAGILWVATSGTTSLGRLTLIALPKRALLCSAAAVNAHLRCTPRDRWLSPLPLFHVGGLAIRARAALSGAALLPWAPEGDRWTPRAFVEAAREGEASLSALVPTQVFDLLREGLRPPPSLRLVLVGGDALDPWLFRRARSLGWPLLPTYGMTEACSQVATASPTELSPSPEADPPPLLLLPHMEARLDPEGHLELRSEALASCSLVVEGARAELRPLLQGGWLRARDRASLLARGDRVELSPRGREAGAVKVGGEGVDLARLRARLSELLIEARIDSRREADYALIARPDQRLGRRVVLVTTDLDVARVEAIRERFDTGVLPFERAREVIRLPQIPRTELGKVRYSMVDIAIEKQTNGD